MTLGCNSLLVLGFLWGQESKRCHSPYIRSGFRARSASSTAKHFLNWISRLWLIWPIKGSMPSQNQSLLISEARISFSRMLGTPSSNDDSPPKLGKVTRRSVKVHWMAGIFVVYHSIMKIPVDWLIMEPCNPCSLGGITVETGYKA